MTTKIELAKYLADYIEHELELGGFDNYQCYGVPNYFDILERGLNAFESTNNIKLTFEEN